jgi:predicted  nucleic acid-binding Zn-ribbon protein
VTAQRKAEGEAKPAKANADKALKDLAQTRTELETAASEATTQKGRADKLANDLGKTTKERNEAQQELSRWQVLGVQPDQIAQLKTDLREASEARAALADERRFSSAALNTSRPAWIASRTPTTSPWKCPDSRAAWWRWIPSGTSSSSTWVKTAARRPTAS